MRSHETLNGYDAKTMKRAALLLLFCVGLSPILFSSCSSFGGSAGNRTGPSYAKATSGSDGVQWTGGNNVGDVN
jgi:hypothetical protein